MNAQPVEKKKPPFYKVFTVNGKEYRAKFENGVIKTLCKRAGPLHSWSILPPDAHEGLPVPQSVFPQGVAQ